jgi:wobble nucleotide-excising tRNase
VILRFHLIRNIGQFESVTAGAHLDLKRLALIYAENGRGKTTIAAILRALRSGGSTTIEERKRLGAAHPPHVVIDLDLPQTQAIYQNRTWSHLLPDLIIYDDVFVDDNVYSGLTVEAGHRQNLNEVILGSSGVSLNKNLQQLVESIEAHNRALRVKADTIPSSTRGTLAIEDFCALSPRPNIDAELDEARRALAAVSEATGILRAANLDRINIPAYNIASITALGNRNLPALGASAMARVEAQLNVLGPGATTWVAQGVSRLGDPARSPRPCPFCTQDTAAVEIINQYRAYFSAEYATLKADITAELNTITSAHGSAPRNAVTALISMNEQQWHYWSRFAEIPSVGVEIEELLSSWSTSADHVRRYLEAKNASPLDQHRVPDDLIESVTAFDLIREKLEAVNQSIDEVNRVVEVIKERAAAGNRTAIEADIRRLTTIKLRYTDDVITACDDYLHEQSAKARTEAERDQARVALDSYRNTTFPAYEVAINLYLQRLNAGFRIDSVTSTTNRGGASCTYNVVVNDKPVSVTSTPGNGVPSFRNVLSAGDRNTLALAFFFASLDRVSALHEKIVVVDDPMTSLDEHRLLATAQQLRRFSQQAGQVIVLSHDKPFLFRVWDGADRTTRSAMEVVRDAHGSNLRPWDVTADMITEHDRRHAALRVYLRTNTGNPRDVAESLRPMLETYLRTSYPDAFGPGDLLGPFIERCRSAFGTPQQILGALDITELQDLKEYANRFHHDSNSAAGSELINDLELVSFARRVHDFMRRP